MDLEGETREPGAERYHPLNDPAAFIFDASTFAILDINNSVPARYGYRREELLGEPITRLYLPDDVPAFLAYLHDAENNAQIAARPMRHRRRDGAPVEVEVCASRLDYDGQAAWYMVVRDVTATPRATRDLRDQEEEARHRQQEFVDAFAFAPIGMALASLAGRLLAVNDAYCQLVGMSREALIGRSFLSLTAEEDVARNRAVFEDLIAGRTPSFSLEKRYRRADGTTLWVRASGSLRRDEQGRPLQVVGLVEDISTAKQAQDALRESEERYRLLFEHMTQAAFLAEVICSADGKPFDFRFLEANPAFCRLVGRLRAAVVGQRGQDVLPEFAPAWIDRLGKVAATAAPTEIPNLADARGRHYSLFAYSPRPGQFACLMAHIANRPCGENAAHELANPAATRATLASPGPQQEPPPASAGRAEHRRRVLVVDDYRDTALSLADLVALLGHEVRVAFDGTEALAQARDFSPEVVLCDIGMPGMSGYDLARALRDAGSEARLVAISGYAQPQAVQAAMHAGFDAHLAKPPSSEDIERALRT